MSQLIDQWQNIIATYTKNLFSGFTAQPGLSNLAHLMKNGAGLNTGLDQEGLYDMQSIMEKTIFGLLIPKAWEVSNEDVHPVILYVIHFFSYFLLPSSSSSPRYTRTDKPYCPHPASQTKTPTAAPTTPGRTSSPTPSPPTAASATTTKHTTSSTSPASLAAIPKKNANRDREYYRAGRNC